MICPNCKHEYFTEAACPDCGLTENAALKKVAGEYMLQECYALASEHYTRIVRKDPLDGEARKQMAVALARLALETAEEDGFRKAADALREALNSDWDWDLGHQYQIQIAEKTGKLDELIRGYKAAAAGGTPDRSDVANRMIQVIQLTLRFKSEKPVVESTLPDPPSWSRFIAAFWPLVIGLPLLWVSVQGVLQDVMDKQPMGLHLGIGFMVVAGTVFLLIVTTKRSKKKKTSKELHP